MFYFFFSKSASMLWKPEQPSRYAFLRCPCQFLLNWTNEQQCKQFFCGRSFSNLAPPISSHGLIIGYDQFSVQVLKYCYCCIKTTNKTKQSRLDIFKHLHWKAFTSNWFLKEFPGKVSPEMFLTVLAGSQKAYPKHSSAFSEFSVLKTMCPIIGLV